MSDFVLEVALEIFISIIEYPGALLHWLFLKKKVPFNSIVKKHYGINLLLSLLLYFCIGFIIYQIIQ
ncbi:hypothetical protein GWA97_03810 [Flavobacterium sp. LaA7.5]|nr:hypothetical protein [Flavobacterium salilacus subsp. altitudinum]